MKKSKKLLVAGLMSVLMLTGCSDLEDKKTEPKDDDKKEETVTLKSISLNKQSVTLTEDSSEVLIVSFDPAEGLSNLQKALTWTSQDEEIATVTSTGKVTGRKAGTTKIVVASVADPTIKAECSVTVEAKDTTVHVASISIDEADKETGVEIAKGATRALRYSLVGENNQKPTDSEVIWSTNNAAVATVDQNGYVTGVSKGTATITVTSHEKSNVSATCLVKVTDSYVAVVDVKIGSADEHFDATTKTLTLQSIKRAQGQLTATVFGEDDEQPSNPAVKWSVVSGGEHITVSSDGLVTVTTNLPYGSANLSAKVKVESLESSLIADTCDIVITPNDYVDTTVHVDHIAFEKASEQLAIGNKETTVILNYFGEGDQATSYIDADFEIIDRVGAEDASILKTSGSSVKILSGAKTGSFKIKATAKDKTASAENYPTATIEVSIFDPVTHVAEIVLDSSISGYTETNRGVFYVGDTLTFGTLAQASTGEPGLEPTNPALTFAVSSTQYALIDAASGYTQFVKAGEVSVIITSVQDPDVSETIYLQVKEIPVNRVSMENSHTLSVGDNFTLNPSVHYKNPNKTDEEALTSNDVTFSIISGSDYITLDTATGKVTAKAVGTAVVRATAAKANPTDEEVYAECTVNVVENLPLIMSYVKPNSMLVYESKADLAAMNNISSLSSKSETAPITKGSYYKYDDEAKDADLILYKVGSQGEFKYNPVALAQLDPLHSSAVSVYPDAIMSKVLKIKNGSEYETLTTNLSTYAELTADGVQFKDAAIGHQFQLVFTAAEDSAYEINPTAGESTLEFEVINAYNAYDIAGLSVFDNHKASDFDNNWQIVDWSTIRSASGVSLDKTHLPHGVVLHNDIPIVDTNLPDSMKATKDVVDKYVDVTNHTDFVQWMGLVGITDEAEGKKFLYNSPLDYTNIFTRESPLDDDFTVDGNFFNVDYSTLKPVAREYWSDSGNTLKEWVETADGSHAQLFSINAATENYKNRYGEMTAPTNKVTFKRVGMLGNGGIHTPYQNIQATNKALLSKGGYIGVKAGYVDLEIENTINRGAFTGLMIEKSRGHLETTEHHYTKCRVDRSNIYDTFSSSLYLHGTNDTVVNNSFLAESAGPLVIMDEAEYNDTKTFNQVKCDLNNCYLHSPVCGDEAWFTSHSGSSSVMKANVINAGIPGTGSGWLGNMVKDVELGDNQVRRNLTRQIEEKGTKLNQINFIALDFNTVIFESMVNPSETERASHCLTGQLRIDGELYLDMASTSKTMTDVGGGTYLPCRTMCGALLPASGVIIQGQNGSIVDQNGASNGKNADIATSKYLGVYLDIALSMWQATGNNAWAAMPGGTIAVAAGTYDYNTYWANI